MLKIGTVIHSRNLRNVSTKNIKCHRLQYYTFYKRPKWLSQVLNHRALTYVILGLDPTHSNMCDSLRTCLDILILILF